MGIQLVRDEAVSTGGSCGERGGARHDGEAGRGEVVVVVVAVQSPACRNDE